jgi:hypothetical protein
MLSWWATCGRDFVAPSWTAASMRSISSLRTWAAAGSIFTGEHDAVRTGERFPRQIHSSGFSIAAVFC